MHFNEQAIAIKGDNHNFAANCKPYAGSITLQLK